MMKHRNQITCLRFRVKVIKSSDLWHRIFSEKLGNTKSKDLSVLCGRCYVFLNEYNRREMILQSMKVGIRYPDWTIRLRKQVKPNIDLATE